MSLNTFGHLFRVTTWGESHGPALGATVDGCPPGVAVDEATLQHWLDKRRPGQNKNMTQRNEPDAVQILSGVFEGRTTGTSIQLMIENTDQRSRDYGDIAATFRPGHADITYHQKYGLRDYRGGGRSSARETAARVAAGGIARAVLDHLVPGVQIKGYMVRMGAMALDRAAFDWDAIDGNDFWLPDAKAAPEWEAYLQKLRKDHNSVGAIVELVARGVPAGLGAPIYGKLDTDLAAACMSINAVKGVEIGEGMAAAELMGTDNADEILPADPAEDVIAILAPNSRRTPKLIETGLLNKNGENCWFEPGRDLEYYADNRDGSFTLHVHRKHLTSRGIDAAELPVVRPAQPRYMSNHAGGILGGISTGQEIVVRFAVKPTSSILSPRASIRMDGTPTEVVTKGRHDPCVGIRAVPVGEAMMACVLLDHLLLHRGQTGSMGPIGRIG